MKRKTGAVLVAALLLALFGIIAQAKNPLDAILPDVAATYYKIYLAGHGFKPEQMCNHTIGQSHIDAAWLWRKAQTHDKVYRTFSEALDKMQQYPGFIFSGSASQYYEWMLEDHPDLFARIVEAEKKGTWEIVGGMWVESDCNIPDGESFARQFLLGQRFYIEHFGHIANICWMPDTFGYNINLPQFIARAGEQYMWSQKLSWNDTTIFPFHNFHWQSPDGSQILMYMGGTAMLFYPFQELNKYQGTRYLLPAGQKYTANYTIPYPDIKAAMSQDWLYEVGNFYGAGDGGAGPRPTEVKMQKKLVDKGLSQWSTAARLFADLQKFADRAPVWNDELYFEYHRGVQTTHSEIKRGNRVAEQVMHTAETIRSVAGLYGIKYPYEALKALWKLVLLNQFHDILPGSSIAEVYEDAMNDHAQIQSGAAAATAEGLSGLAKMVNVKAPESGLTPVMVFNALAWPRSGLAKVELKDDKSYTVLDGAGAAVPAQADTRDGKKFIFFRAESVPAVGYKIYYLKQGSAPAPAAAGLSVTDQGGAIVMENDLVRISVDKSDGLIHSLQDKARGKELIASPSNKILAFRDRDRKYRAWNIDPNYLSHPLDIPSPTKVEITSSGPLWVEVKAHRDLTPKEGGPTTFDQRVRIMRGDPVVYLDLDSDFHIENSLVKLEFNTTVKSDKIAADNPYIVIERPTHPTLPAQKAAYEMVCHKWIDLSDSGIGLSLLNNGKYGFSLNPDGTGYRLSVIKGAEYPSADKDSVNVEHYKPGKLPYTDQGMQHVQMGLLSHQGTWREAKLWQSGYEFNTPLETVVTDQHPGELPMESSFVSLEADGAYIGAIKKAEDDNDLVLRVVEAVGQSGLAHIKFGQGLKVVEAAETDLLERHLKAIPWSGSSATIDLGPYQVRTIKVKVGK